MQVVRIKLAIEDTRDSGLPRAYAPELYNQKCAAVFEHVYDRYPDRGGRDAATLPGGLAGR